MNTSERASFLVASLLVIATARVAADPADTAATGRTITSNTAAQYHLGKYIWPELEINSTFWHGGARDGKAQTFLTPGIMASKFALRPRDGKSRLGFAAGFGFQTATTTYRTYNHSLTFTSRLLF